jgi:hypothetical protein
MSNFRWNENVRFNSAFINASKLPWYYILEWIIITTPIITIALFIIGFFKFLFYLLRRILIIEELILAYILIIPILSVIVLKSTLYDGWRHMYFLHIPISFFAVRGYIFSSSQFNKKIIFTLTLSLYILVASVMVKIHPYQYLYFNPLPGERLESKFDLDYWGLTNSDSLKFILNDSNKSLISIYPYSQFSSLEISLFILDSSEKLRLNILPGDPFFFSDTFSGPDYVFSHHRGVSDIEPREFVCYQIIRNFIILNNSISYIYKKKESCAK